jgi:hypothetical protein
MQVRLNELMLLPLRTIGWLNPFSMQLKKKFYLYAKIKTAVPMGNIINPAPNVQSAEGKFEFKNVQPGSYIRHSLRTGHGASLVVVKCSDWSARRGKAEPWTARDCRSDV